jgi:malate dehydrogenase (oxaloacetate-decarboxylating)
MNYNEMSLRLHEKMSGKLEIKSKVSIENKDDLSVAYTPGVAEPCRRIHENKENAYKYTCKGNMVAVVTDGSAVLGLGNIGPEAALPVMEGKAILFKEFANVDAFPICLDTQNSDEIVQAVKWLAPGFGGINLEDISAPRCFEIEKRLKEALDIPVFHDDQHGTAIVVCAALINALKIVKKEMTELKIVVNGAGAAGTSIIQLLKSFGCKHIIVCDKEGILNTELKTDNPFKLELSKTTNPEQLKGDLSVAMRGADFFIGVSAPNVVTQDMIESMAKDAIVFAMANPTPEIMPDLAYAAGARIVGTGRSDFSNQINNVLAFPGIFRGALDARASDINEAMKIAAVHAIANMVTPTELNEKYIIPNALNKSVGIAVAEAVAKAAIESGVSRVK